LDNAGVDLDAAGGCAAAGCSVGIFRHQLHIHKWRFSGLVEMPVGVHRVVPVTRDLLSGELFSQGSRVIAQQHDA